MKRRKPFESEEALAAHVVQWLEGQGYDVYQEVPLTQSGAAPDIIAVSGRIVWIIECKLSLGLSVLAQADGWRNRAHFRSVAVPETRDQAFACEVAQKLGIGVITLLNDPYSPQIKQKAPAQFFRRAAANLTLAKLKPEHKTFAKAGTASGHRFTEYRSTCESVRIVVQREPGITLTELMTRVTTHYASPATARSTLVQRIEQKLVPGVRLEREGKLIRLYPAN